MRKILIVDGDYEFTRMVISFLENGEFEVAGANNLAEARAEIARFNPDLVLLSRELIGESGNLVPDGLDLLKEMKTHSRWKKIPVIFMVSSADGGDLEKLRRLKHKADDYTRKPLEDNDLLRRIENLIGFDPEETNTTLRRERDQFVQTKGAPAGANPQLQSVAEKELQELFGRLGEESAGPDREIDFATNVAEFSIEQLRNELEFIQAQVRDKDKQRQGMREKWKRAGQTLKEHILRLERERGDLQEKLNRSEAAGEGLSRQNQELLSLLGRARDFISSLEKLTEKWDQERDSAQDLILQLERLRKK